MTPVRKFSALWDKKFSTENLDTPPPPSYPNFFDTRNYCNSKGFPNGIFRHCETKNFRRKILILFPPPLIQTFSIPEVIATVKDSRTEIFGTVRQKHFDGKSWYSLHPSLIQTFSVPETNETLKGSPTKFFGTVGQKVFDGKSWHSPPPSHPNFFDTRNFCNSKGFPPPYGNFRHCETKNFWRKILILPPLLFKLFRHLKFATVKDSPTDVFGTVRQKTFDGKSWYSLPPPFYPNFFDTQNYCNGKRFPYGKFRHCVKENFRRKNLILPPLSHPNFLDTRKYCNSKWLPYGNFRHCETKNFRRKILILFPPPPPLLIQTFSIPETIATVNDSPTEIFGTVRQKFFDGKSWYSPPLFSKLFRYPKLLQQ